MRIRDWRIVYLFLLLCCMVEMSWATTNNGPLVPIDDPVQASPVQRDFQDIYQKVASLTTAGVTIPSGMIAMFSAACPSGWTRFSALDNAFPYGGSSYGATGGSNSITLSVAQLPAHSHTITDPGHTHNLADAKGGAPAPSNVWHLNDTGSGSPASLQRGTGGTGTDITLQSSVTGITATNNAGSGSSIDIHPAYVTVVWCQKN